MSDAPIAPPKLNPPFPPHPVPPGAKPTKVPGHYLPQLSLSERDRRWDQLRKRMHLAGYEALLFLGNDIYWDMGIANIRYVFQAASKISTYGLFFIDQPPPQLLDIFKVCVECLDVSKQVLKAGTTLREAWEAIRQPCQKAGNDFVELGFHLMGLGSPEFPTVIYLPGYGGNALNGHRIEDFVLEEGMTFGNNLDIFNPNWKPDVGCMYSDFMVVRPDGAECLIGTPRQIGITG